MTTFRDEIERAVNYPRMRTGDTPIADDVLAMPEMEAIRRALRAYAHIDESWGTLDWVFSTGRESLLEHLPAHVVDWILS
jgi:hypothetical protein